MIRKSQSHRLLSRLLLSRFTTGAVISIHNTIAPKMTHFAFEKNLQSTSNAHTHICLLHNTSIIIMHPCSNGKKKIREHFLCCIRCDGLRVRAVCHDYLWSNPWASPSPALRSTNRFVAKNRLKQYMFTSDRSLTF
jgi:hypothetical protein